MAIGIFIEKREEIAMLKNTDLSASEGSLLPPGAMTAVMAYWGWDNTANVLYAPDMTKTRIMTIPHLVSAEMALDAVSRSWIVRIGERSCIVVERIEYRCFTPIEMYDIWEEYE